MTNHEWYLRFKDRRYEIDYRIYHLTGRNLSEELTIHEIEYNGKIVTKRNLEDAVKEIGKLNRKR